MRKKLQKTILVAKTELRITIQASQVLVIRGMYRYFYEAGASVKFILQNQVTVTVFRRFVLDDIDEFEDETLHKQERANDFPRTNSI